MGKNTYGNNCTIETVFFITISSCWKIRPSVIFPHIVPSVKQLVILRRYLSNANSPSLYIIVVIEQYYEYLLFVWKKYAD